MSRILFKYFQGVQVAQAAAAAGPLPIEALTYVNPPTRGPLDYDDFNGHGRRQWVSRSTLLSRK